MRTINIDTENAAAIKAGNIGEHNATTITFTVSAELAAAADYYRGAIEVNGEVHYTLPIEKGTETQHFNLESEHTAALEAGLTIEGYKDAGNFVGKSAKTVLCFGDAASGDTPAENTGTLAGLVDAAVEAAVGPAVEAEVETQVGPAVAEALAGFAYGVAVYASADDLPAGAATNTLAIVKPAPAWDREPAAIWKGEFFRRLYYNESPPNPLDVLPEAHPDCEAIIAANDDAQAARPIIYFQAAWAHDFLDGNPGLLYMWGFDENGDATGAAIYTPVEINTEIEGTPVHFYPGWYSFDINTGEATAGTFAEMGIPEFDFEPRMILNPDWLTQVVPLGYHLGATEAFDNIGLGYFMAVTPYTEATVYHKTETGWEAVT